MKTHETSDCTSSCDVIMSNDSRWFKIFSRFNQIQDDSISMTLEYPNFWTIMTSLSFHTNDVMLISDQVSVGWNINQGRNDWYDMSHILKNHDVIFLWHFEVGWDKNLGSILARCTAEKMLKRQPKFWIFFCGSYQGKGLNSDFWGRVVCHYLFNENIQKFTLPAHALLPAWLKRNVLVTCRSKS